MSNSRADFNPSIWRFRIVILAPCDEVSSHSTSIKRFSASFADFTLDNRSYEVRYSSSFSWCTQRIGSPETGLQTTAILTSNNYPHLGITIRLRGELNLSVVFFFEGLTSMLMISRAFFSLSRARLSFSVIDRQQLSAVNFTHKR